MHSGRGAPDSETFSRSTSPGGRCRSRGARWCCAGIKGGEAPPRYLGLFEVTTPDRVLNNNVGINLLIYQDLGTGPSYGRFRINTDGRRDSLVRLPLNKTAVAAINDARGHYFSIGGRLLSINSVRGDYLFGGSGPGGVQALIVRPRSKSSE